MLIQSKNEKTLMTGTSEVLVCYSEYATNPTESLFVYRVPTQVLQVMIITQSLFFNESLQSSLFQVNQSQRLGQWSTWTDDEPNSGIWSLNK